MKQLYDKKSLPEMQMVEVETRLQQARSMYELSKKNMNDCALHAPFAGVVGRRTAEVGENASPGVPVLTLLEISRVKVRISVPENEIARLDAGTSAVITVSALGGKSFEGRGVEKSSAADAVTHTYDARITLPNPRGELLPGMVCDVVPTAVRQPPYGPHYPACTRHTTGRRRQPIRVESGGRCGHAMPRHDGRMVGQ